MTGKEGSMVSVAVLCGGKSERFGSDKAVHEIGGKQMYRHVWDKFSGMTDDIFLQVAKAGGGLAGEVNEDSFPGRGPLGGIASALTRARHERVFVVACDMPFVDPRILGHLAAAGEADIIVPRWRDGKTEPTCAIFSKRVAPVAARIVERGPARISTLFSQGPRIIYVEIEPLIDGGLLDKYCFVNVNTPGDLDRRAP